MKNILSTFTVVLMLNEGFVCWFDDKGVTDNLFAATNPHCVNIPTTEDCFTEEKIESIFKDNYIINENYIK